MKYNVAFFDTKPYDKTYFDIYGPKNDISYKYYETRLSIDTVGLAKGADAVCVFVNDDVTSDVVSKLYEYGIRIIVLRSAGFNNVCVKACYKKIHVYRVPAYSPYSVAEYTMALLLTIVRKTHKAYNRTRDFNFSLVGFTGFDIRNKTIGIIGTGKIGRAFYEIVKGFGSHIIAYDPYPIPNSNIEYSTLDNLLANSDIISLHCPLTSDTFHMINSRAIQMMKDNVVIVNTSRGALIDSESLLEGIKNKKIKAAALDVYEEEANFFYEDLSSNIIQDDILARLISLPNVIVTSHQAFLTEDALESIAMITSKNIIDHFQNIRNDNEVCYKCGNQTNCAISRKDKCF